MRFNQNPFKSQLVRLDPTWSPLQPLHDSFFSYDFDFENEVLTKSTQQLQDVISSEPCSNKESSDELVIPIEDLIAGANVAPSQVPTQNGNSSQVNIEDFDSHNTDPFQDAELKTINDMAELQAIFPFLPPQDITSEGPGTKEIPHINCLQDTKQEGSTELEGQNQEDGTISSGHQFAEEIHTDSALYANINEFPSALETVEAHSECPSPKPPVPIPRKLKNPLNNLNPTPIPRHSALKSPVYLPTNLTDAIPILPDASKVERNENFGSAAEPAPSEYTPVPLPPEHSELENQEIPCPDQFFGPTSQFYQNRKELFVIGDLSGSIAEDIRRQVNISQQHLPLSEEEIFFKNIADMGFPLDCVKNISKSFDTKDERQILDHVLAIQHVGEENNWPIKLVETAYVFIKGDLDKIKAYIETFLKYKEMGFPDEKVHGALEKCGKDYEKMLEILIEKP